MPAADDLLEMLASETDRRAGVMAEALEGVVGAPGPRPELIESLRAEAHGLKGAALVVGQEGLAGLAGLIEAQLVVHGDGMIDSELANAIRTATDALRVGAHAAAEGAPEPAEIAASIAALSN